MTVLVDAQEYPGLARIITEIVHLWPKHERYLAANMAERDADLLVHSERLAQIIIALSDQHDGGLAGLAGDYRFLCEDVTLPEEMFFRRNGRYRLSRFEDALAQVYANSAYMTRYMNGLLVSDVIWINHCRCMKHYAEVFLPSARPGARLLEIGPGHGLLLQLAAENTRIGEIVAWDVSDASLKLAHHTLETLRAPRMAHFEKRNIFDAAIMDPANAQSFDAIVFSEVLEHVEDPLQALKVLFHLCKPGGRVWINVPANSPAPDHLFLINEPKEAADLVEKAGFQVVETQSYPMSGVTLERAIRQKLTVSCVVVGQRPAAGQVNAG